MRIQNKTCYLLLRTSSASPAKRNLCLLADHKALEAYWRPGDQLSPLFPSTSATVRSFDDHRRRWVFFVGPIYPGDFPPFAQTFLTLGSHNVFAIAKSDVERKRLTTRLKRQAAPWEVWTLLGTAVEHVRCVASAQRKNSNPSIIRNPTPQSTPELRIASIEYQRLMSSVVERAGQISPALAIEFRLFDALFRKLLAGERFVTDHVATHGLVTVANAALARHQAQTYPGRGVIAHGDFYYQSHSLLGIGTVTLAIAGIRRFVLQALSAVPIVDRIDGLRDLQPFDKSLYELDEDEKFWRGRDLDSLSPPTQTIANAAGKVVGGALDDKELPLITCVSSRDGFRTTQLTLSVPRDIIAGCNTPAWTLQTITHEISHVVMGGVLGLLLPDPNDDAAIRRAVALLAGEQATSVFDQLVEYLCHAVVGLELTPDRVDEIELSESVLREMVSAHWLEANEILTHVFDYLFFYGKNAEQYIDSLWASWAVIPNIQHRVHHYIVRCASAMLSGHLTHSEETGYDRAVAQLLTRLRKARARFPEALYIPDAIAELEARPQIFADEARRAEGLVKFVRYFLYSPALRERLMADRIAQAGRKAGYPHKSLEFPGVRIENPLRFIDAFSRESGINERQSAWLLQNCAFAEFR